METIIAGRFETLAAAQQAEAMLIGLEFAEDDICSFALNPPSQHATYPIGGDEYADDNSRNAGAGAARGGAIGGAYTGALAGALHSMGTDQPENTPDKPQESRPAGVLVAVRVEGKTAVLSAQEAFRETGASAIEIASGTWQDGTWTDFNPQSSPTPLR